MSKNKLVTYLLHKVIVSPPPRTSLFVSRMLSWDCLLQLTETQRLHVELNDSLWPDVDGMRGKGICLGLGDEGWALQQPVGLTSHLCCLTLFVLECQ